MAVKLQSHLGEIAKMNTSFRRLGLLATVSVFSWGLAQAPAAAQTADSRYGSWAPPGATGNATVQNKDIEALLKELDSLVTDAEKARAANPVFLRDLKVLAAKYQNPWGSRVLFDDFSDGDFQRNPAWSVTSGEYWVEQGYGLRSRIVEATETQQGAVQVSKEQLAISILGAVLQGANKNAGSAPAAAPSAPAKPSAIETKVRVSNAFSATIELSSWKADGTFAVAMTQGLGGAGYHVEYRAGPTPSLELVRVTSRGRGVIDTKAVSSLEDQKVHSLEWTRTDDGTMAVGLDGKTILSARDASFRDPFDGLVLSSLGADVIVKSVSVLGPR